MKKPHNDTRKPCKVYHEHLKALNNDAAAEQRAICDCRKKIERILKKDPEADVSYYREIVGRHCARNEELIQEIYQLELRIATERGVKKGDSCRTRQFRVKRY